MSSTLKLTALDVEDLAGISACLQDSLVRVADTAFESKRRRFALLCNRFRWENEAKTSLGGWSGPRQPERVRAMVHFDGVKNVRTRHLDRSDPSLVLSLMTIDAGEHSDGSVDIRLIFAGGPEVLLEAECIDCYLEDISQPWPASGRPEHED